MSGPRFTVVSTDFPPLGESIYCLEDLSLTYHVCDAVPARLQNQRLADLIESRLEISSDQDLVVVASTLTMMFDSNGFILKGLDAYTNQALWSVSHTSLPTCSSTGILRIDPESLVEPSFDPEIKLKYEIAHDRKWVRIRWPDTVSATFALVGSGLIAGLSGDRISDLYLLNVNFA